MEMGCTTIALRFDWDRENKLVNQKLHEIHTFDAQNLDTGLITSEYQTKSQSFSPKQEIANLNEHFVDLKYGIEDLQRKIEGLKKTLDEQETKLDFLEKAVEQNKINQGEEMKKCEESFAITTQNLGDEFERAMKEARHNLIEKITEISEVVKRPNQEFQKCKEIQTKCCRGKIYCQSYIGQVCLTLQVIMYHIVLPDQFAEGWLYKVKDIEEDIDDDDMLNDEEREEASKRWEDLKEKLGWDPSLERTLKMLQEEGNPSRVLPESLTVEEAERVAEVLNQQGRLRGKTSYEKVKKVIEMLRICADLVQSS